MALESKSFKDSIKFKKLKFNDEYFILKNEYISSSDGINFFAYNALNDVNDVKSNNFSNLILTKKQKNSKILEARKVEKSKLLDIVTTLSFFSAEKTSKLNPGVFLAADKSYYTYDINTSASSFYLTEGTADNHVNYLFRVECINELECTISHSFGDNRFYLAYDDGFKCITDGTKQNTKFIYHIDGEYLKLYFKTAPLNQPHAVKCIKNENSYELVLEENAFDDDRSTILYINRSEDELSQNIDASWARYNRNNTINGINSSISSNSEESQFIIHHEYSNDEDTVNFIPLKNTLTYQGTVTNGSNLTISSNGKFIGSPLVNYRNYSNINSGCNQELGTENITLTFTFTDQVLRLKDGDTCYFSISESDEVMGLPALYPYERLNLNDSAFVRNGAFGSDSPFFADTFSKFMNEKTSVNNYTYLCTWLYQPDESSMPMWVDRYYYPDLLSRNEALSKEQFDGIFNLSFENLLDQHYFNENSEDYKALTQYQKTELSKMKATLQKQGYIDKKSDLCLQGGTKYRYSRISSETVENVYDNLAKDAVSGIKDQSGNPADLGSSFAFNNKHWREIPAESFQKTCAINFNTNLYINPAKKMGIQLFGCDYKHGFNIQNRKDLCPFTYYANKSAIYLLNNSFNVANKFDFSNKYGIEIKYAVIGAPFDDIYVFSDKMLFIFDYDLRLKSRIELETIIKRSHLENSLSPESIGASYVIQHNRNLFAVINNKSILKIIFNPENDTERKLCASGPACRKLSKDEYITNYNIVVNPELPQTAQIIKSLYIANGKIYAFNYDIIKMSSDGDTLYGLTQDYKTSDGSWYYIFHQTLSRLYTTSAPSKYAEFVSENSIDNLAFGSNDMLGLIRGFKNLSDDRCLEIYDKSKTKIYNYPLREFDKIISFDFYRYIGDDFQEHDVFVALGVINDYLSAVEYHINKEKVQIHRPGLKYDNFSTFKNVIDSNSFITNLDDNKLFFNLYLEDGVSTLTHEWDLKEAQEGWYNINVKIDIDEAEFEIKINDSLVKKFDKSSHLAFLPHTHTNTSIFDYNYYYGAIGKRYGTTLGEVLRVPNGIEPYSVKNTKCENTTLYKKTLAYHEYQANRLHFGKINDLILTIPCGIHNGIEEIVRSFKYNKPSSVSNSIKINISGVEGIKSESEMNRLKSNILLALKDNDCLTNINEIEFI